jgi:amino acid permease
VKDAEYEDPLSVPKAGKNLQWLDVNNRYDAEYDLPVTAGRNGTWFNSAFHNITAMVGAGVLGLPYAMVYLGWPAGVVIMTLSWVATLYTLWQMCDLHQIEGGRRFNRYHELGQYAIGRKWGLWIVIPCQLIVMVGLNIVYCVTAGKSLRYVWVHTCHKHGLSNTCDSFGLSAWIVVYAASQILLSQLPNFHKLSAISLVAAIMSILYSSIAIGMASSEGRAPDTSYNLDGYTTADGVFGIFNALGTVAFAYGGHNVVMEIQATLPSVPTEKKPNPTKKPMMFGVYLAYFLVAYCYFGVAYTGYHAFGNKTGDQILYSLGQPVWLVIVASIAVVIHVCGSFQVYAMPVYDMIEYQLVKRGLPNGGITRVLYRSAYVVLVAFVGITIPFFGDLLGFIGALGFGPTTYTLPSWFWLIVKRPPMTSWHFWASWFCIISGILITVLGAVGGMRGIIVDASSYNFYQ